MTEFVWRPDPAVTGSELAGLRDLLLAVHQVDGRPSLPGGDELPGELRAGEHLFGTDGDTLVGYLHLEPSGDASGRAVAELFVRPDARRRGVGGALVRRLVDRIEPDGTNEKVRVWAHGDHPAAARLARRHGFQRVRELRRMRATLSGPLPEPRLPEGVRLRAFEPGRDEDAFIEVNRRAFAWHPEQGALTVEELRATEGESWFDAEGFLLAVDSAGKLLGFHWTKVHPEVDGAPMGEVYVVGVDPAAQGGGLGRALTLAGLRHLHDRRGLDRVMLYVESDNAAAITVYTKLGFTLWDTDVQYAR